MDEIPSGPFEPVPASKEPCEPTDSDVLCGRGGTINTHPGNAKYRNLVEERKRVYLTARFKREKRLISESIIKEIRNQNPPGRFLNRDTKDGDWYDIGDIKAREKTSQALRENLPKLRKELEAEKEAEKEAAAAKKKKEEEEEKERKEQERIRREQQQQQWAAGGYSPYGHPPPHYSQHHGPPPPHHAHQNYYPHQQAPPSRSFSSGGSGSASAASGSMGSGSYHHHNHQPRAPHPPPPHHHNHHPRSSTGPAPAPAAPSGPYPFGLPPRNEAKAESSVFNAVTSAFGFGPASSHPSAPPAPASNHPGAPSNNQHQHQEITADEADEVARLMLQDSPHPDSSAAEAAAAIAEPIPASSSNLTSMDDKSMGSGMFSMAQHILFSWDNKSTATGKTSDKTKDIAMGGTSASSADAPASTSAPVKTEGSGGIALSSVPPAFRQQPFGSYRYEDEVSEEGQEVELLEMSSMDTEDMPPPPPQQPQAISRRRLSTTRRSRGHQQIATRDHEARDPSTPPSGGAARQHLPSNVFLDSAPHTPGGAHSLDDGNLTLEGMSLCSGSVGTTLGGQSLMGVFDDHQSTNENTSSGESGSISTGTRASSGNKGFQQPQQAPQSGGAGTGGLKTNHNNTMGPPLSPMVAPPRSRHGSETHSVGDHSLMSVRSESKASVASSYHRLGSLALSPSTESALNACAASTGGAASIGGISFPDVDEDMMMDGPTIELG